MNDEQTKQPGSSDKPPKEKGGRSKFERIAVWTVIGLLVAITAVEALAQQGFSKSLTKFQEATDDAEERLTLEDFETEYKQGFTTRTAEFIDGRSTVLYKWPSLFRRYELNFVIEPGEEQYLFSYWPNDDPAAVIQRPRMPGDDTEGEGLAGEGMAGMPGPGPGAGRGGGGGGRGGSGAGRGGGGRGGAGGQAGPGGGGNPLQQLLAGNSELKLTDEQKTAIQELIESQKPDESLTGEERIAQFRTMRENAEAKLKEILDEQQLEQATQLISRNRGAAGKNAKKSDRPDRPE